MKRKYAKQLFKIGAKQTCQICKNIKPLREFMKLSCPNYFEEDLDTVKYKVSKKWDICRSCEQNILDEIAQEFEDAFVSYRNDFTSYMINLGVSIETAEFEVETHIESMGISEIDLNDGALDAQECLSCWD